MRDTWKDVLTIVFSAAMLWGYVANIYRLSQCDFEPKYRAETIRICGIVFPPVGVIIGYIDLGK
jgi:hypothetical protein